MASTPVWPCARPDVTEIPTETHTRPWRALAARGVGPAAPPSGPVLELALSRTLARMDRPPPDPAKLLEAWMESEHGDLPPGRVMATFKTGRLRDLLEALRPLGQRPEPGAGRPRRLRRGRAARGAETWTPVV